MAYWSIIKKWSEVQRKELTIHALWVKASAECESCGQAIPQEEKMVGYVMKTDHPIWLNYKPSFYYTLYEGNIRFAMSVGVADTLAEAKKQLKGRYSVGRN